MSYNGSGLFQINTSGQPVVAGTVITASAFNALTADLATGLTTAITKDGQTTTTARITFAQGLRSTLVTDSTTSTSGSIITDGGLGVAKAANIGTTLGVTGAITGSSTITGTKLIPTGTSATGNGMYLPATNTLGFSTNGILAVTIDGSQQVGINTTPLTALTFAAGATISWGSSLGSVEYVQAGSGSLAFGTNGTQKAVIDSSGNVGVGVTPSAWGSGQKGFDVVGFGLNAGSGGTDSSITTNGYFNGTNWIYKYTGPSERYSQLSASHQWFIAPSGTAGNAITFTQAMTLSANGNLLIGTQTDTGGRLYVVGSTTQGDTVSIINGTIGCYFGSGYSPNAAASASKFNHNSSTNRSINAGGTINASGADYAEYMTKAADFAVAKGDVIGINAEGKLTNVFNDAVSFAVKSTNPSYVGGDVWGSEDALGLTEPKQPAQREATKEMEAETDEEFSVRQAQYVTDKTVFDAALEMARQRVDRIAFAGQVPVNVTGATAGQYIVPVNDNGAIKGEAVSNPTFEQYQQAVGKVIAIEQDGRARIIVKVA